MARVCPSQSEDSGGCRDRIVIAQSDSPHAVKITMTNDRVRVNDEFRYFMGVCRGILADRAAEARAIIASGEV